MTRRLVRIEVLALLGWLFKELQLTFELESAERIGHWFWVLLEEFLSHPAFESIEEDFDFKQYCVNRILYGRSDLDALKSFSLSESLRLPGKPIGKLLPE